MNTKNLLSALCLVSLAACGGGNNTQQYLINWDLQTTISASRSNVACPSAPTPQTTNSTTTDAENSMVITIYQGDASTASKPYYADFGAHTLSGTKSSSGVYNLSDAEVKHDTTAQGVAPTDDSDTVTVTITQNGGFITGTWSEEKYHSDPNTTTGCLTSTKFRGQQINVGSSQTQVPVAGENH